MTSNYNESVVMTKTRIAVDLKRLLAKVPGGETQIASLLTAMYLWRDDRNELDEKLVKQTAGGRPNTIWRTAVLRTKRKLSNQGSRTIRRRHSGW